MRAGFFSPLLILLILTMLAKASLLFGRIQEQTTYGSDTHTSSVLIDTAYAKEPSSPTAKKTSTAGNTTTSSEPTKRGPTIKEKTKEIIPDTAQDIKPVAESPMTVKTNISSDFSKSELDLLKELSKRREKLEQEKKDLNTREQVLRATETKIDQKVDELKRLQGQLEELMKQYDQKEHGKIMSLVKIYETMKPKDAANIFNELEMPVLLRVVSNMKEVKVAPIIASMSPNKARELSIELAKQKPIN